MKNHYLIALMALFCVMSTPLCAERIPSRVRFVRRQNKKGMIAKTFCWLTGIEKIKINKELVEACYLGNKEDVKFFLELGADVNFRMPDHRFHYMPTIAYEIARKTALGAALSSYNRREDSEEIVMMLLEYGANINMENGDGETPLWLAIHRGRVEGVKVLLENGAWINVRNKRGGTALMSAVCFGRVELVRILLECGAWVNLQDKHGITALMSACSYIESTEPLLRHEAEVNVQDEQSRRAFYNRYQEIVELLLQHGAIKY